MSDVGAREALEITQSLLALQLELATARLEAEPGEFSNGFRAGVIECLGIVNELLAAGKRK